MLGITILFAVLSFFSGLSASDVANQTFVVEDGDLALHYNWGRAFTFLAPVVFGIKYADILSQEKGNYALRWVFRILLIVLTALAGVTGYLGGELVFIHGAGVRAVLH